MSKEAGLGASGASPGSLEQTLDRAIDHLSGNQGSREARALLIEARRLRSVVANWRSIPPPQAVFEEMLDRILHLSTAAGVAFVEVADSPGAAPEISVEDRGVPSSEADFHLDFEPHLYTLETDASIRPAIPPPAIPRAPGVPKTDATLRARPKSPPDTAPSGRAAPSRQGLQTLSARAPSRVPPLSPPPEPPPTDEAPPTEPRGVTGANLRPATPAPGLRGSTPPPPRPPSVAPPAGLRAATPRPQTQGRTSSSPPDAALRAATPARTSSFPPAAMFRATTPARPSSVPPPAAGLRAATPAPALRASTPPPARTPSVPPPAPRLESLPPPPPDDGYDQDPSPPPPAADLGLDPADVDELGVPRTRVVVEAVTLAQPVDESLLFLAEPYSARADVYRALRRKLAGSGNPRVIGVTSAHPGEGKTTFAMNLALALREGARGRVLLVEANHRAPAIAKVFGFPTPKCFLVQAHDNLEDPRVGWLAAEPMPKLHVLPIDPQVKHPPLLDSVAFSSAMERLKQAGYEYIVVDSPPVIGSVDCNAISDCVEGMIITALTMRSKRREMRKAVEQIEPAPILGVVVLEAS